MLGEATVLKITRGLDGIRPLKREVALGRLLVQALGARADILPIKDSNLVDLPLWVRSPWIAGGNLTEWLAARGDAVPLPTRVELLAQILSDPVARAHLLSDEGDLESAQLRVRTADRGAGGHALDKMESALVAIRGLPWTTFPEMKGDNKVLTK